MATAVVEQSHSYWLDLVKGNVDSNEINYNQTSRRDIKHSLVSRHETTCLFDLPAKSNEKPAAPRPKRFDQWFYLDEEFKLIEKNVVEQ